MFNIGDKVKCIKSSTAIVDNFKCTKDKVYEVVEYNNYGNDAGWNSFADDNGQLFIINHWKCARFFELLTEEKPVSKVNYHYLTDSVIISHEGVLTPIKRGDARFTAVVKCIKEGRLHDIVELLEVKNVLKEAGLTEVNGIINMDGEPMPESLSRRIQQLIEEEMPIDIMKKFWQNLKDNPSFNSRKMLYAFLEHNGHPLTEDGCFIAYRGITEDFKDVHTRKFDNSVGQVIEVKRSEVDDNPNNTCSFGLHVACFDYAKSFGQRLVEVKVNPKDVVAVPVDYNGTKMRVCKFEVLAECEQMLTGSVYGRDASSYDDRKEDNVGHDYFDKEESDDDSDNDYYDSEGYYDSYNDGEENE